MVSPQWEQASARLTRLLTTAPAPAMAELV
jgi:hypothetical protein